MVSRDANQFYAERDRRTRQMGVLDEALTKPVEVIFPSALASSRAAQISALALVNMVARLHRRLRFAAPAAPLLAKSLVPATNLQDALVQTARAIDPFVALDVISAESDGLSVQVDEGPRWYLGVEGACGIHATLPQAFSGGSQVVLGAGMAACMGAAAACRMAVGKPTIEARVSAWDCTEGAEASVGAPLEHADLGSCLIVGGGAVASALAYWVRECDLAASWVAIDRDDLALHNTNRCLCSTAADAGWPAGTPLKKVEVLRRVLGAEANPCWYDEWIVAHPEARPDLVLPLANARHVRRLVGQRFDPVVLHATTSASWQAQLHRHIGGLDDCIECRMRTYESSDPVQLACSTAGVSTPDGTSTDAALPFLSGAAGLLLASALWRLAAGDDKWGLSNGWSLHFDSRHRMTDRSQFACGADCPSQMPSSVRQQIAAGSRWEDIHRRA
jgi:hypothetical protein